MNKRLTNQSFRDGKRVWKVLRLIALAEELKPFNLPMKHLNICNLFPVIKTTLDFVSEMKAVLAADLTCPIILDEEGYVMDGRHRVLKSLLMGEKSIKAVRFDETPPECFTETDNND